VIRRYYPWGSKKVPYGAVRSVRRVPLGIRKWRIWGSGDVVHWWNLDPNRPRKQMALDIDVGKRVRPMITPDDWQAVEAILLARSSVS
jgi:hypothetical protein